MAKRLVHYLRTDERQEAVRSLEWAAEQASQLEQDPYLWKWLLVAMHNAIQGFLVLALWNGNGLLTLTAKGAAKWLEAYNSDAPFPVDRLDKFLNLYEKVKVPEHFHVHGARAFTPGATHDKSMEQLNEFRNEFIHFTPKGWSLQLAGLPTICLDGLDLIRYFGWETTPINWYKPSHVRRAQRAHNRLRRILTVLHREYAG